MAGRQMEEAVPPVAALSKWRLMSTTRRKGQKRRVRGERATTGAPATVICHFPRRYYPPQPQLKSAPFPRQYTLATLHVIIDLPSTQNNPMRFLEYKAISVG
ncbi:hypothetical protein AAG570_009866 [Ranatra chinensis]|uniref:Uncharacterized protein n=1 Tax=Ranatra chinensis TaxID=642074 RepID=A0ABD0YQA5_9HEMI